MTIHRVLRALLIRVPPARWALRVLARIIRFNRIVLKIVRRFVKPQPKHALILVPILLFGLMKLRGGGPPPLELHQPILANALTIEAPAEVPVGTPYTVTVSGLQGADEPEADEPSPNEQTADEQTEDDTEVDGAEVDGTADGPTVTLLVDSGYQLREFTAPVEGDTVSIEIPAIDGPGAGVTTLSAIEGDRTGHANVNLIAGGAVNPLELFLGPRTIEALSLIHI